MITRPCTDCSTAVDLTAEQVAAQDEDSAGAPPIWCDGCLSNHDVPTTPVARLAETVPVPNAAPHAILSERAAAPIVQLVPLAKLEEQAAQAHAADIKQDVVDMLEDLLEEAKRGELTALAVAAATSDGGCRTLFTVRGPDTPLVMGAIAMLQHRYNTHAIDEAVPTNQEES